jgi:hypothetical protein
MRGAIPSVSPRLHGEHKGSLPFTVILKLNLYIHFKYPKFGRTVGTKSYQNIHTLLETETWSKIYIIGALNLLNTLCQNPWQGGCVHFFKLNENTCSCVKEINWSTTSIAYPVHCGGVFFKYLVFITDGWLTGLHNRSSVKTVPATSYIEVLQNISLCLFRWGEGGGLAVNTYISTNKYI